MGSVINRDTVVTTGLKVRLTELDGIVVRFTVNPRSHSVSARWRRGELSVVAPPAQRLCDVTMKILSMRDRILARRPQPLFADGMTLTVGNATVAIGRQSLAPDKVCLTGARNNPKIGVGSNLDFDDDEVNAIISRLLCLVARNEAPSILLPRARQLAAEAGVQPASWSISRGHRVLGHCNSRREIAISEVVIFLTPDLQDYIINHELAHLTEMNHSPRFHHLCDIYCHGKEKEYIRQLKNFKWPILKL